MSSLTIARRFFASAFSFFVAAGCRCSDDERVRAAPAESERAEDEAPDQAPDETEAVPESEATGPTAAAAPLETVTADALLSKLKASGRKGTVVNAWASFCGPCKREIPMLETLAEKLRPRGLDVVLVSVDEPGDQAKAEAWLKERAVGLTSYLAARPLGAFKRGMNPGWPGMLPASFLFDEKGTLRYYWGGEAFEEEMLPVLEAFLAGKPLEAAESTPAVAPENSP